jgi:hypothetical protein
LQQILRCDMIRRMSRRVLIFVAIRMEAQAIARALGIPFDVDQMSATGPVSPGLIAELKVIGICGCHLPHSIDATNVVKVISAGLAGALDPALGCGDVVVDRIHSTDRVITTPAQKAALFEQTGAAAVDMESAKIRKLASAANLPFTAIRAISDTADEAIPPTVLGLVDPMGNPRPGAVAAALLGRPWLLPHLLRLRRNSEHALKQLGAYLAELLGS